MTITEYLKQCGQMRGTDERETARQILLGMPADIDCNLQEYIDFLDCLLDSKQKYTDIDRIAVEIKNHFLLAIGWHKGKPAITECFEAWLNLDTMELSAVKPYDAFTENDNCVLLEDYRKVNNAINWRDLVIE